MKPSIWVLGTLGLSILALSGAAHPPAADLQQACLVPGGFGGNLVVATTVKGTLSYLSPAGASIPGCAPFIAEWGSHAPPCPPAPFIGPIAGAFCGPMVLPGGVVECTWTPIVNTVPTKLVVGLDVPKHNGMINVLTPGEMNVYGPYNPSAIVGTAVVANPLNVPVRAIAYPTTDSGLLFPPMTLAPGDINQVDCV